MEVKLLKPCMVPFALGGTRLAPQGSVVDLDDQVAKVFIARDLAEPVVAAKKPAAKKKASAKAAPKAAEPSAEDLIGASDAPS